MKRKKIILILASWAIFLPAICIAASSSYTYTPMESIPGFGAPESFPAYIQALYKFLLWTIGISAMLMISIGGFMYLTSAGNASQSGKAKGVITDAIIGLALALVSWLLLYTINPSLVSFNINFSNFSSSTTTNNQTDPTQNNQTGTTEPTTPSGGVITAHSGEDNIRQQLKALKISVNKNPPATEVNGLRQETIDGVVSFQKNFGGPVMLTGGSESGGPHASGAASHAAGYKVDIEDTLAVNNYITANYKSVPVSKTNRKDITAAYTDGKGNMYYKEGSHWDVCYQCNNVPAGY